ncbi:HD family phosphohydrolase [Aureibacillus halotolerans]|uniref:HD/PDEase domain-containing protein n=1 Tax=Aureibacillus halotolerans TaxID=1508390 RepID=A0A4R6U7I3_9BACI|nr:HD family phosphohydrolase [Aureibacillus halotolerans]TDQ41736.1 hypothetical protein EV213_103322 [Aureibacillus halotolerans]
MMKGNEQWSRIRKALKKKAQGKLLFGLFLLVIAVVMYSVMFSNVRPERVDVSLFSVAPKDIYSPITVEDTEATEAKIDEALAKVEYQYVLKREYRQNQIEALGVLFRTIENSKTSESNEEETSDPSSATEESNGTTARVEASDIQKELPPDLKGEFTDQTIRILLNATPDQLAVANESSVASVHRVMDQRIAVANVEEKKDEVRREISYTSLPDNLKSAVADIAASMIIPNYVYDPQATSKQQQEVRDDIEPVMIQLGQLIVREGQLVDREIYRELDLVGVLDHSSNPLPFIGLALLVGLLTALVAYYTKGLTDATRSKRVYLYIYTIIFSVMMIMMKIVSLFQPENTEYFGLVVPIAAGTMLIKMLIHSRVAIMTSIVFAITGGLMFSTYVPGSFNYDLAIYFLASSLAGTLFLSNRNHRARILQAGIMVALINIVTIMALALIGYEPLSDMVIGVGFGLISGIAASILSLGLLPFFEAGFGMLSTIRLIELSSPNHPMLRKILVETPGTYHHSVMVANLSEAACEAVGANGLLARVGAYYHDIGKTKRPHFFIENQMGLENPHNKIAPQLSKTIITAHATDGAEMLRENKLPTEIVDIAAQHHGTTLLKYFYHKANEATEKQVPESEFRYAGPKAQTKESAIIGICDSVEAAVRSLSKPNPNKIEGIVRSIISDRLQDGQFDECDITLKELDTVAKAICETLKGIFHSRIEYPDTVKKKVKQA